jgi:hypothetical protein
MNVEMLRTADDGELSRNYDATGQTPRAVKLLV